ncbi:hypothetical protein MCOR02_002295 [Pyricularia oryzae]|nr:hypothetical protein MCOR02_002295 [Pyricularia oryzae]
MDYHQVHGKDISSFDLPSTHRLPTVSAAQAQEELTADPFRFVSTGLDVLDTLLAASKNDGRTRDLGGVQRGIVTEIWGPPGIGKTSLGLQLASNALASKRSVVWTVSTASAPTGYLISSTPSMSLMFWTCLSTLNVRSLHI